VVAITTLADTTYARVRLTVTGAVATDVTVERIGTDHIPVPVRNADPGEPIAGTFEVYDYEAPLNTPVTYRVTDDATVVESSPVTVTSYVSWLKAPHFPALNVKVQFLSHPQFSRVRPQGVHRVLNRADPVVVFGTLGTKEGTLELLTGNSEAERAMEALVTSTGVVLLQVPNSRVGEKWLTIGDVTDVPFTQLLREETVKWSLQVIEVTRPDGALIGNPTATYQQLKDGVASYQVLKNTKTSYLDVMRGVGVPVLPPNPGSF